MGVLSFCLPRAGQYSGASGSSGASGASGASPARPWRVINLDRRPDKFLATQEYMRQTCGVEVRRFSAVDGKEWEGLELEEVERLSGCRVYRRWVVVTDEDVTSLHPELEIPAEMAWDQYCSWFDGLKIEKQLDHLHYFCRAVTYGEIGCALSHLDLWQEHYEAGDEVVVVLEDDARPRAGTAQAQGRRCFASHRTRERERGEQRITHRRCYKFRVI